MSRKQPIISLKAIFALVFYLIIPSVAIYVIISSYPELSKDRFISMIHWVLPTATIIVILAQLSIFFEKKTFKRYLINIGYVVTTMMWVYGFLGGSLTITSAWNTFHFSIHLSKYVILIILVACINVIYYTLEWQYYRKKAYLKSYLQEKRSITSKESTVTS
jgi:hypothetical protein